MLVDIDKLSAIELRKIAREKETQDSDITIAYLNKSLFELNANYITKQGITFSECCSIIDKLHQNIVNTHNKGDIFVYDSEWSVWDSLDKKLMHYTEDWADKNLTNITTIKLSEFKKLKNE